MTRLLRRVLSALRRERAVREEIERLAGEQAALRRVATLVARAATPEEIFAAVAEELARLSGADIAVVLRYETAGAATVLGCWGGSGVPAFIGTRLTVAGEGVAVSVRRTGQPARAARLAGPPGSVANCLGRAGMLAGSGSPVVVGGRPWGVMIAASARQNALPSGTEHRLAAFAELVAAAIASAEARAELTASRARIAAAADETRRRIERDLHDGAQQQLVTLAVQLRAAQAMVPPGLERLQAELDRVAAGLTGTLDELREYTRGIHPAILAAGGLAPALKALARRSPLPVTLDVHLAGRLPERAEVTAYYVVSEALANAAKHAGASAVDVDVDAAGDVIRLAVRDDGDGGSDPARGSGLVGLKDRVEAIGGALSVRSRPGEGTALIAELPARPGQSALANRPRWRGPHLAGPGAPDGGNSGRARTRVPQSCKRALPDSAHAARPARLRLAHGAAPPGRYVDRAPHGVTCTPARSE
jgi:signal transduction histidine kinase